MPLECVCVCVHALSRCVGVFARTRISLLCRGLLWIHLWTEPRSRQSWSVSCSHAWPYKIVLAAGMPAARFKWIRGARSEATEREGTVGSFCSHGNSWKSESSACYKYYFTGFGGIACVCNYLFFFLLIYLFSSLHLLQLKLWDRFWVTASGVNNIIANK